MHVALAFQLSVRLGADDVDFELLRLFSRTSLSSRVAAIWLVPGGKFAHRCALREHMRRSSDVRDRLRC